MGCGGDGHVDGLLRLEQTSTVDFTAFWKLDFYYWAVLFLHAGVLIGVSINHVSKLLPLDGFRYILALSGGDGLLYLFRYDRRWLWPSYIVIESAK